MTTKGPSRKQVIVPINKVNVDNILASANKHVTNINRALKMSSQMFQLTSFT